MDNIIINNILKAKVKVPKKKLKSYRKILKGVGIKGKKQNITK